ncbi:Kynureninase (L-kynurenine hydrolase) [Arachnomyces sp. PD_36]|nr:Kynureninase (L-kynurenine hydrolase) [Arachnomyces sp. PD_36]
MGDFNLNPPLPYGDDIRAYKKEYAQALDARDPLRHLRDEFIIPSKKDLKRKTLAVTDESTDEESTQECTYLCGNSLGLQPKRTREYLDQYLRAWATKGVTGHFTSHEDAYLPKFVDTDEAAAKLLAPVVGAFDHEVAAMGTLTTNLHLLMASFYRPTKEKYKIILESKAFPSDHYAVESQIRHHNMNPKDAMVLIEPKGTNPLLSTDQIIEVIEEHAETTALVLLPAIQYYSGQYFDIKKITAFAHSRGILIGWDCAHAAGNVDLKLHDWDVDFAVWCSYKYMNTGPGVMAAIFVHQNHGIVDMSKPEGEAQFRNRLTGWWSGDKVTRFNMDNQFKPQPGAAGFQISNPSVMELSAVMASLSIFSQTSMAELRKKSLQLTGYMEHLLLKYPLDAPADEKPFTIITPSDPSERGAQLSLLLNPGYLESVFAKLDASGVIVDERKPDVIRVAPAPLYNTFSDVWEFCQVFLGACRERAQMLKGKKDAA